MVVNTIGLSLGKFRRFGAVGPTYEILGINQELTNGDKLLRVRVLESGEEVDYLLSHALQDPEAD